MNIGNVENGTDHIKNEKDCSTYIKNVNRNVFRVQSKDRINLENFFIVPIILFFVEKNREPVVILHDMRMLVSFKTCLNQLSKWLSHDLKIGQKYVGYSRNLLVEAEKFVRIYSILLILSHYEKYFRFVFVYFEVREL